MKNNFFAATGIVAAFGLVLVALPSHSAPRQNPEEEQQQRVLVNPDGQNFEFSIGDGGSWLGVTADTIPPVFPRYCIPRHGSIKSYT